MQTRSERKDAAEHRKLILRTAESLFCEHGVSEVSMHQIAKTAGIGQGTLYRRYAHKGDLCMDILLCRGRSFTENLQTYLDEHADTPPEERLGRVLDSWIDNIEQHAGLILTIESHHHVDKESSKKTNFFQSELYLFMRERISALLAEIAVKRPDSQSDPLLTAHALICAMAPSGYFHIKQERGSTTQQLKNDFRRICRLPVVGEDSPNT